jgi:hypothetical protein
MAAVSLQPALDAESSLQDEDDDADYAADQFNFVD